MITKIEKAFSKATEIWFSVSRFANSMDCVYLGFEYNQICADEYYTLCDIFKNNKCVLVIYTRELMQLDISIVNETTSDIINLKNLIYDESNLNDFVKKVERNKIIGLIISFSPLDELIDAANKKTFRFLGGYAIRDSP